MKNPIGWAKAWYAMLVTAPPFSKRRADLLAAVERGDYYEGYEIDDALAPKPPADEVRALALHLQSQGPDEYPYGFYEYLATERLSGRA